MKILLKSIDILIKRDTIFTTLIMALVLLVDQEKENLEHLMNWLNVQYLN